MLDEKTLVDLLVKRDYLLEQGHDPSPEQVCDDCPELIEEFKAELEQLRATDWMFDTDISAEDAIRPSTWDSDGAASDVREVSLPESPLTCEGFLRAIADSGLLSAGQIAACHQTVSEPAPDARSLARDLVRRGLLTRYQASVLLTQSRDPLILDRYVILDTIDSGGMGRVFKALHRPLNRTVALKTLPPSAVDSPDKVKRFEREAKAAALLSHPNIITTYDAHACGGVHFLVMQYVAGKDLEKTVRERGPLPVATAVDFALQVARGLEHAHARGIVHRDVKPGNLLVDTQGTVRILDLGVARLDLVDDATAASAGLTQSGGIMGTVAYMSPEQAVNAHNADSRSDIYSLGCTLYFLLTGHPPFVHDTLVSTILAHRDQPIPQLERERTDVSEDLIAVYRRMMAKQPKARYRSMAEVIEALSACHPLADGLPQPTAVAQAAMDTRAQDRDQTVVVTPQTARRASGRRRWIVGAVTLLLLAGVSLLSIILKSDARPGTPPPLAVAPFSPQEAQQHQRAWADYLGVPVEWKNSLGMEFVLIPPGEFLMGSPDEDLKRFAEEARAYREGTEAWIPAEGPQHRVRISQPFYLGKHEVTQAQWEAVVGHNPSLFKAPASPVDNVSWNDAQVFIALGEAGSLGGPTPVAPWGAVRLKFALPTEAQWEYACRAGTTSPFYFGDSEELLGECAWYRDSAGDTTHAVGQLKPNAWGLYDLYGNVWEWCADWYARDSYAQAPATDPPGPAEGEDRAFRGGSYGHIPVYSRSAFRRGLPQDYRYQSLGFRLAAVFVDDSGRIP